MKRGTVRFVPPTMSDVARLASVSKTTVSHVVNGTRFVEEMTRQRVLQAIAELGYHPSTVARSLKTRRTQTIGVLISDLSNHFFAQVLRGIEDELTPARYSVVVCEAAEMGEREADYLDLLLRQRVDGIVAAAASQRWDVLTEFELEHTPVVFVDRCFEGLPGPFIGVDNRKWAYLGASHLIARGHRRIGFLAGNMDLSSMRERLAGFRQALEEHRIPLPEGWVVADPGAEREMVRRLLSSADRPSALFCSVSGLSLLALQTLRELGLRCPQDLALVAFDDHPWATVSDPPLTVIRQPAQQLGRRAAQILLALINGEEPPTMHAVLDCELIIRQSS